MIDRNVLNKDINPKTFDFFNDYRDTRDWLVSRIRHASKKEAPYLAAKIRQLDDAMESARKSFK